MKKGDLVEVIDNSYAVRVDKYNDNRWSDLRGMTFEVINCNGVSCLPLKNNNGDTEVHDVFIQSTETGSVYLHSKCMLRKVAPKVKEVTMADLEEKYGCKVKVVK